MRPEDSQELERRIVAALGLAAAEQPAAFDRLCADLPQHAEEIRRQQGEHQALPARIGRYEILRRVGRGGFGVVYLAKDPKLDRKVALKLVSRERSSDLDMRRFERERHALALMQHPGIVQVSDSGSDDSGRPWFVMEFVANATRLHDYCDKRRLSLPERLELFCQVCDAVEHAHHKGVIHRDLTPSNVLVTEVDGKPVAKVIDFGLAKSVGADLGGHTRTIDSGRIVGTVEYMSPEQADPQGPEVDTRTDVWSLGVVLYELLTGEVPFPRTTRQGLEVLQRVQSEDAPRPSYKVANLGPRSSSAAAARRVNLRSWRRTLKSDLDWILLKALDRNPNRRYRSPSSLADELRRYLADERVEARPPSTLYELRKFARRNKVPVTAAGLVFVSLALGLGLFWVQLRRADALAKELEEQKKQLEQRSGALQKSLDEFDLLAGVWHLKAAREEEATLYPAWPEKLPAMEEWLASDVPRLREALPKLKAAIASLKSRAKPRSAEDLEAERRAHPRFGELEALRVLLAWRKHGRGPDLGGARPELPELSSELARATAKALNSYAWARVDPDRERDDSPAEAPLALAAAQRAVERIEGGDSSVALHLVLDTLNWAWLALGEGEEALAASRRAHEAAPEKDRKDYAGRLARIEAAARELAGEAGQRAIDDLQRQVAELEARIENERRYEFDADSDRFLFEALRSQDLAIEKFLAKELAGVEQRRGFARRLQDLATTRDAARWAELRSAVRAKHGFDLKPQGGLVPLGANPKTGYFEFYELRSAWDGKSDPASIAIPAHDADGRIAVKDETGIVFVLLPGGSVTLGAQDAVPGGPNYDPAAESYEDVHTVRLAPFFLARHEMTQAQYLRLTGQRNPSSFAPGSLVPTDWPAIGWAHPVENLDWEMARQALEPHGLILPTEAQWEYGCRGGTTTAWYAGSEPRDLRGHERLTDGALEGDSLQDHWSAHWPVGTGAANAFGLFDVHGNVTEWCRDWYGDYGTERPGDGLRSEEGSSGDRVYRGGHFFSRASFARSAYRDWISPPIRNGALGVRAARLITE